MKLPSKSSVFYPLLLFFIPFITYLRTLSGGFVWDDYRVIHDASALLSPFSINRIPYVDGFYRPIASISLQLDYLVWGMNPFGYHLTNLIIHSLSVVLLFAVLKRIVRVETAFFAALLFGVHPAVSEVVSWVSCRFDLLTLLFALLAMYCLLLYLERGKKTIIFPVVVFALFSLLSKETGIVLILLLPAIVFFYKRDSLKPLYFLSSLLAAILLVFFFTLGDKILARYDHWGDALVAGIKLFGLYIYKVFSWNYLVPYNACLFAELGSRTVVFSGLFLLVLIVLSGIAIRKRETLGLGAIWFAVALIPGIYISLSNWYRLPGADRFLYSALPGFALLFVCLSYRLLNRKALYLSVLLIPVMMFVSYQKAGVWSSPYTLWREASEKCGNRWTYPLTNYASAALHVNPDESEDLFNMLITGIKQGRLKSIYPAENELDLLVGLTKMGGIKEMKKEYGEAEKYYVEALKDYNRLIRDYPRITKWDLADVNYNIARFYYNKSLRENNKTSLPLALQQIDLAVKYRGSQLKYRRMRYYILFQMGRCNEAIDAVNDLLTIYEGDRDILRDLYRITKACKGQKFR
ncbi:MAG TPA: hypothetical protein ENH30_03580 [Nitrospirae bacterium]|nr:hypothetical protein [Nitrospirota bacterium]